MTSRSPVDLAPRFLDPEASEASLSELARGVVGSEILKIAAEIRALKAQGRTVCNLTVGDFDPGQFPAAKGLVDGTVRALQAGHTNYPPSDGVLDLRLAIVRFYERELGLRYPVESIAVAGGARPIIYGAYATVLDPGDTVVYPVPSWNNDHYVQLAAARGVPLAVGPSNNFFPTADELAPHVSVARLIVINSPLNPTGTVIRREQLADIASLVVEENRKREAKGRKGLFLLFDQVYWTLTFGEARHYTPVGLVPESAPYVILLDAVSKAFAATGLRVGWCAAQPAVTARMRDVLGHVGAWAPKAEQVATAGFLDAPEGIRTFQERFKTEVKVRLDLLYAGLRDLAREGFPVEVIEPQGAIYLAARFDLSGKGLRSNEEVRRRLLEAGVAIVPFQAFGLREDTGWFRLSVGAVSLDELRSMFPRLREVL